MTIRVALWLCGLLLCTVPATADDSPPAGIAPACGSSEQARKLASLIINDPQQRREVLECNGLLSAIADAKAREMASLGRVDHMGRSFSNRRLVDSGYPLSDLYPRGMENNVEAIAGGISSAEEMWQEFRASPVHRVHLLAEHEFYLLQDEIGVGFFEAPHSPHVEYWVVYVAHQDGDERYRGSIAASKN